MRLQEYKEIVFDEFPKLYDRHTKVFLTNLLQVDKQLEAMPQQFSTIYTTDNLAKRLRLYLFLRKKRDLSDKDFVILTPFQPLKLRLSDGKRIEVMICEGCAITKSLMVLIRKDRKLEFFYSAVEQSNIREVVLNSIFAEWIKDGCDILFLNLQWAYETGNSLDEITESLEKVISRKKLRLLVPYLGFEYLIHELGKRMRKRISIYGKLRTLYMESKLDIQHFQEDALQAQIIITGYSGNHREILPSNFGYLYNVILKKYFNWKPLPTPFNLELLCNLVCPRHIDGIIMLGQPIVNRIPKYIYRHSTKYKIRSPSANKKSSTTTSTAVAPTTPTTSFGSPNSTSVSSARQQQLTQDDINMRKSQIYRVTKRKALHYMEEEQSTDDED